MANSVQNPRVKNAGRPELKITPAMRRMVSIEAGAGVAHEEIARRLHISRTTLLKHFQEELTLGGYQRRADMLEAMFRTGLKGNVAAQKAYLSYSPAPVVAAPVQPPAFKPGGKKAQAQADAVVAQDGTDWADILPDRATQ